ncbi:hypothetical protein DID88_010376 [Monilinia fructigena]|uniref:Uncharacterized protein n=1 Tax=Monilinia fructigena TaxID=38457 RepID=A0A395ID19_9HELO|nr:hypothetical protein DID88_010376 [Monilinia fructigena]
MIREIVMDDGTGDSEPEPVSRAKSSSKKKAPKARSSVSPQSSPEPEPEPETRAPPQSLPNRAAKLDRDISSSPEPQVEKVTSLLDRTNAQIAELKASMKRNVHKAPEPEKKKSALEAMITGNILLSILEAKGEEEEDDDFNDKGWMSHALSFKEDKLGKDLSYRKKAEDELVVIDPREKAKTLREEMKAKREARAGASTGREWDVKRNEKLARGSALAGRVRSSGLGMGMGME